MDIDLLNENFESIDAALKEIAESGVRTFDNLLAYPGCTRTMTKSGSTYTEQIKTGAGKLRAARVTDAADMVNITETYTFYAEDGEREVEKFTVRTTNGADGNWTETVEKGN